MTNTSESDLQAMWDTLDGMDRDWIADHVTLSCGLKLSDKSYSEALESLISFNISVFERCVVWVANGRKGELYD